MAIFVDLDEESEPPRTQALRSEWDGERAKLRLQQQALAIVNTTAAHAQGGSAATNADNESAANQGMRENPNRNRMTEAFGCYPIVIAVVSWLDLNTLDNLARTCRQIRENLLQYRRPLVTRTLHCYKEQPPLEPEENEMTWYHMSINESYKRKGSCARDMVAECRRCAIPVCRNCVIRPPGPSTFRDRHRRLCIPCTKAPAAVLARPSLLPATPIDADEMQRAICTCERDSVWLCQPCGRNIIGADQDYRSIWRWRNQYGEVLGGTGIGEGDRGVICGREAACLGAKEVEQETDCDAADAREQHHASSSSSSSSFSPASTPSPSSSFTTGSPLSTGSSSNSVGNSENGSYRTPSPHPHSAGLAVSGSGLRPGYARHEIEGIGGVVKTKLVRMLRVGACVPEWEDEKNKGQILEREVTGGRRSWCGWCLRVIPGARDMPGTRA
ncbi:putative sulfate transporter [Rosellinia necatrix]|uniref:Putative sulfate transporter n=1 Tax=Rosellinia necatrix TaxID=77044 RepID=A0A1S7UIN5_ROSNE|nr:putative sulfate transporter [Rosellinia necatrix]